MTCLQDAIQRLLDGLEADGCHVRGRARLDRIAHEEQRAWAA
jgi:hypothetical protein